MPRSTLRELGCGKALVSVLVGAVFSHDRQDRIEPWVVYRPGGHWPRSVDLVIPSPEAFRTVRRPLHSAAICENTGEAHGRE